MCRGVWWTIPTPELKLAEANGTHPAPEEPRERCKVAWWAAPISPEVVVSDRTKKTCATRKAWLLCSAPWLLHILLSMNPRITWRKHHTTKDKMGKQYRLAPGLEINDCSSADPTRIGHLNSLSYKDFRKKIWIF